MESQACLEGLEIAVEFLRDNKVDFSKFLKSHGWNVAICNDFFFLLKEGLDDYVYLLAEISKANADFLELKNSKAQKIKNEKSKDFEAIKVEKLRQDCAILANENNLQKNEIELLKNKIKGLQNEIIHLKSQRSSLQNKLNYRLRANEKLQQELQKADYEIDDLKNQLKKKKIFGLF